MRLYNKSNRTIEYPRVKKDTIPKCFSWGFYCFKTKELAEKYTKESNASVMNVYELRETSSLNIKIFSRYSDEWLEFVTDCMSGKVHGYDIVIGVIPYGTIYKYLEKYIQGIINKRKFFDLVRNKRPIYQISFHTIRALDCIEFVESYEIK